MQGLRQSEEISAALAGKAADMISFEEFLRVIADQPSRDQDPHWRRQSDHIGFGIVNFDSIIHLEDLDASWDQVAQLTSTPDLDGQYYCKKSTRAGSRTGEYFTPEATQLISQIYSSDYQNFGYSLNK
jgi:hypothetical protein